LKIDLFEQLAVFKGTNIILLITVFFFIKNNNFQKQIF